MEGIFQAAIDNCCWSCWPSVLQTLLLSELWRIQTACSLYVHHDSCYLCLVPPHQIQPCQPAEWIEKRNKARTEKSITKTFHFHFYVLHWTGASVVWNVKIMRHCNMCCRPSCVFVKGKREREKKKKDNAAHQRILWNMPMAEHSCNGHNACHLCAHPSHAQLETA